MEVIEKRRWYINENKISTVLMRFHIEISLLEYYSNLEVTENGLDFYNFRFCDLENAFHFVENDVIYSKSIDEVKRRFKTYKKQIRKERQKVKKLSRG